MICSPLLERVLGCCIKKQKKVIYGKIYIHTIYTVGFKKSKIVQQLENWQRILSKFESNFKFNLAEAKKSANSSNIVIFCIFLKLLCWLAGLTMCTGPCGWWDSGPVASARFNSMFMFKSYTFFNIIAYFFQPFQKTKTSCEVAKSCFYYTIFVKFSDIFSLKKKHENACFYEWFHFTQCTKNGKIM